jgi:hypothetical protein
MYIYGRSSTNENESSSNKCFDGKIKRDSESDSVQVGGGRRREIACAIGIGCLSLTHISPILSSFSAQFSRLSSLSVPGVSLFLQHNIQRCNLLKVCLFLPRSSPTFSLTSPSPCPGWSACAAPDLQVHHPVSPWQHEGLKAAGVDRIQSHRKQ